MKEPIEYTKWSCAYKCRKSYRSKKRAIAHQLECSLNPHVRSCKTCAYGGIDTVDEAYIGGGEICYNSKTYRTCDHPVSEIQDDMINILEKLQGDDYLLPVHKHCVNWKAKDRKIALQVILENMDADTDSSVSDPVF